MRTPPGGTENIGAVNYDNVLLDFVKRTQKNLEVVDGWQRDHPEAGFNEVTHRINSLLGLVVLPREAVLEDVRQLRVDATGVTPWGGLFTLEGLDLPSDLRQLVKGLRNSIAHNSIEFMTDGTNITGVVFHARRRDDGSSLWWAGFELDELDRFLSKLTDEVIEACHRRARREGTDESRTAELGIP